MSEGEASWAEHFAAGTVAGMAGVAASHPWDTLRVRLQVAGARFGGSGLRALRATVAREGVRALWKGVGPPLAGIGLQNALLFSTYGPALARLRRPEPAVDYAAVYAAGCAGGAAQSLVCSLLELCKIRMQMDQGLRGLGMAATARKVLREPFPGPLRGLGATLLRDCPSYGVWYVSYEWNKSILSRFAANLDDLTTARHADVNFPEQIRLKSELKEASIQFVAGGVAGMVSWTSVYPIDVVKSRVQSSSTRLSITQAFRDGYRQGGIAGFFPGYATSMARGFVASAVTFLAFELAMKAIVS